MPLAQQKRDSEMNIRTIPHSEFDRLLPYSAALENLMVEQVEWFSGSTDTEVTKSPEDRLVQIGTAVHSQGPLGPAGIPACWRFSRDQSAG